MALSYYSNWGDSFQHHDTSGDADDPELQALLHGAWDADGFFNPNDFLCFDQNSNNSLLYDGFSNGVPPFDNNLNSLLPDPFLPHQETESQPFHYPQLKRQKCFDSHQINSSFVAPNPCLTMPEDYSPSPFLVFPSEGYGNGSYESARKETSVAPTVILSPQSAAARQRRRRITEKTQELGKLVPGGQKMNTAEMLQSAYKYIKFLQAQVTLLEFFGLNNQEVAEPPFEGEEVLQSLLQSPLIQEKLYSTETCVVPHKLVDEESQIELKSISSFGKASLV